jgi:hypothetical protein
VENRTAPDGQRLLQILEAAQFEGFREMCMQVLVNSHLIDETPTQWAPSRTLLSLVLLEPRAYEVYEASLKAQVPESKHPKLSRGGRGIGSAW